MKENTMNETVRMQQLAGLSLIEGKVKPPKKDIDSTMMDLEMLINEAWETLQYHWGEVGTDEADYRKAEKGFSNIHKEFLKIEKLI